MRRWNPVLSIPILVLITISAAVAQSDEALKWTPAKRVTLAIQYPENESSIVDMAGTGLHSNVTGRVEVKRLGGHLGGRLGGRSGERSGGRTRLKARINGLEHPQTLGACYTSYVLWAVTPEGRADNLGEWPQIGAREIETITPHRTFGLIVTAEPHALVTYPGPMIVAENVLRKDTRSDLAAINIEYPGDPGTFYLIHGATGSAMTADYNTPLEALGARRAVEIARRAGAADYASQELRDAESRLVAMERIWSESRKRVEKLSAGAYDVMRMAEAARAKAVERAQQARTAPGRHATGEYEQSRRTIPH